ncbi:MAG: SagB/ThcOx family dehydrogenase [Elusimicrobiota bacterium]|jgi:nitroreductase|nr:SagB/ThcOx family dehydrogenase [Elusimicrobiota bacterium]
MKKSALAVFICAFACAFAFAVTDAPQKIIKLKTPQFANAKSLMTSFGERKSVREFADVQLSEQVLSDLLWAAIGVNRPDGRRTAPTAMNRQEIDVYACLKEGAYLYNAGKNQLELVSKQDCRLIGAPITLLIVGDTAKNSERWAIFDAGAVSQNISLFCAGTGLATVPRGQMPAEDLKKMLKLKDSRQIIINHPVGYPKTKVQDKDIN